MLDKHGNEVSVLAELLRAAKAGLAAIENPGDLTADELGWVQEDLSHAIGRAEASPR